MSDQVDWDAIAQEVRDSTDPITPDTPITEELLVNDPEREHKRNVITEALFTGKRAREPKADRPKKERKPLPPKRKGSLTKRLEEFYVSFGMMLMPFDSVCGTAVVNSAERCAEALDNLAYENDAVRRAVLAMLETNAWGQVIMAHAPILMMVMTHHVPAFRNGIAARFAGMQAAAEAEAHANGETS